MRLLVLLLAFTLVGCSYHRDGTGHIEFERHSLDRPYNPEIHGKRPFKFYGVGNSWYLYADENSWRRVQQNRYDRLYAEALEKGVNPDWYVDRHMNEDEANSHQ
jgi:hypothetical protein